MAKKMLLAGVALPGLTVAAVLVWPAPIVPAAWSPAAAPALAGPFAPNTALRAAERLDLGGGQGAEDVALDAAGRIYGGTVDGRIVRLTPANDGGFRRETFADTGGRPLGLHFTASGLLVVADAVRGLLAIDEEGCVTSLTRRAGDRPFGFTDDLDVARDGRVYFSDASWRFGVHDYLYDLLEARPHGRLLRYDPTSGATEVLLDDLYFANGVALSQDEDFVLVNETYRYRILRYWLTGERAGSVDVFADNLPGFPDGVSSNRRGTFWVAMFTVRNPTVDRLHPHPRLKRTLSLLPRTLWPKPAAHGLVLALDEDGRVVRSLQDPGGAVVPQVTSAEEVDGFLYLGNLDRDWIARLPLAAPGA